MDRKGANSGDLGRKPDVNRSRRTWKNIRMVGQEIICDGMDY